MCVCMKFHRPCFGPERPVRMGDRSVSQAVSLPLDPIIAKLKFTSQPYIDINMR